MANEMLRGQSTERETDRRLLSSDDVPAFETVNGDGASRFVLICEHAGTAVPAALGDLGLSPDIFGLHIASDIGAAGVARGMAEILDAPLVLQPYSRLVVDSNRSLEAVDCIPEISDTVPIPGNAGLSETEKHARYDEIHGAFHREVTRLLDGRPGPDSTIMVSIHSFTPQLASTGVDRPWEIGLLFNRDDRFARRFMPAMRRLRPGVVAAFNEPYKGGDATDYSIPVHGERRGIEHVLIEIRNDLIATPAGQAAWAAFLAEALQAALSKERSAP